MRLAVEPHSNLSSREFLEKYYEDFVKLSRVIVRRFPAISSEELVQEVAVKLLSNSAWSSPEGLSNAEQRKQYIATLLQNKARDLLEYQSAWKRRQPRESLRVDGRLLPDRSGVFSKAFLVDEIRALSPQKRAEAIALLRGDVKRNSNKTTYHLLKNKSPFSLRTRNTRSRHKGILTVLPRKKSNRRRSA